MSDEIFFCTCIQEMHCVEGMLILLAVVLLSVGIQDWVVGMKSLPFSSDHRQLQLIETTVTETADEGFLLYIPWAM